MKKLLLIVIYCLFVGISSYAQTQLWGMTWWGGANGLGTIFKTDASGNNQSVEQSFVYYNEGKSPLYTNLVQASDGKLYGMTQAGGANNMGVLFQYDPITSVYIKKLDFAGTTNGSNPYGSLMQATDGKLYGMTYGGGANGKGVLFQFNPATSVYIKKLDFAGTSNGRYPHGSLMQATDGKLYGMTSAGGANDNGVLFQFDPSTSVYTKKLDFAGTSNGDTPYGSLIQATDGKLYGMTSSGGTHYSGVLFQFDPATSVYVKKLDFEQTTNGSYLSGSLVQASDGTLYGMTYGGGANNLGVLFQFDLTTSIYTKKLDFSGTTNGSNPYGSLMKATDGKLYGMTSAGGANGQGVLFQFDPTTSVCSKKLDFAGITNGSYPAGSLIQATDGKLYGMTSAGGANNNGVLFQFDPTSSGYVKMADFNSPIKGSYPTGSLMQATDGKLYGMTNHGGANDIGVLFQYDPLISVYTRKLDFAGNSNGSYPRGSLIQATDGKLYGMTNQGGVNDLGVLFQFDPATSVYVKKLDFAGTTNGSSPQGSLIQATDGKLYGMTGAGGANDLGVLFQFDPATSAYVKKFDFDFTNGSSPTGSLMQATDGKLYGMTYGGGPNGWGVLFQFDPTTSIYTKKLDFAGISNGRYPKGSLMQATDGKLYGMTYYGGANTMGVLFQFNPTTSVYVKKLDFAGTTNGSYPYASLMQATDGKLYGMASQGGTNNQGVLFQFDPATSVYTKKLDFNSTNGANPEYTNLIEVAVSLSPAIVSFSPSTGPVGTLVSLTGANLGSPTAFTIGGASAIVVSKTATTLIGMVMPGAVTGVVSVTTANGTTAASGNFTVTPTPYPSAQQGNKLVGTGAVGAAQQGFSVSISADGNTAIVGCYNDNSNIGAAWIYTRSGGVWTQQGNKLVGTGAIGVAQQGYSVSISADGNAAIVGGIGDNNANGAAWVYIRSNGVWSQQGNKLVGTTNPGMNFQGYSVSISADGNTALVGGPNDGGAKGAAWVFTRSAGVWSQQGSKLVGLGATPLSLQGCSVSISSDGNTAILGGYYDDNQIGAAWIFTRSAGVWSQQGSKLIGTNGSGFQGQSVCISADGNTALVGGADATWAYTRSAGVWTQQGNKFIATGSVGQASLGSSVSITADGNTAIVGGSSDNSNAGALWVFTRTAGVWAQQGSKLVGTGAIGAAQQGISASISSDGNTAMIGGNADNSNAGAAWVFTPCSNPAVPTLSTSASTNCGTQSTTLSIATGTLNGATTWQWYSGSCGGTSLGNGTSLVVSPAATTTYYARGEGGCATSGSCANITITVNTTPTITATTPATRCGTGTLTLGATAGTSTLNWYAAATGGTILGTGISFTTPSISTTTSYYVDATNACGTSPRTLVIATINSTPTITATTPASRCETGTLTLGATASAGILSWYAAASGGTALGTGISFTTPSIAATTTYYVDATDNSCTSARTAVIATINTTPTITATTPATRCGTGTLTLGATASAGTLNWYAAASGGSTLGTGISFATPSIAATTTYYVDATANSCVSGRTAVIATVNPLPTAPVVGTITQPTCAIATGSVTLSGLPASGTWTINPGNITGTGISNTLTGLASGSYTFSVTNAATCTSSPSGNVLINAQPTEPAAATASTTVQPICAYPSGTITVSAPTGAGYEYNIDGGTYQASPTFAALAAGSHTILVRKTPDNTCISTPTTVLVNSISSKTLNITLFPEGLYNAQTGLLTKTQGVDNNGNLYNMFSGTIADTLSLSVSENTAPYNTVYSAHGLPIHTDGTLLLDAIPCALTGSYYLTVRHRNHIETWSLVVPFTSAVTNYNFTDAITKAWGSNLKPINGKFCMYAGDVNGDGAIGATDVNSIQTSATAFFTGYRTHDVNGDGVVDALDLILTDNNAAAFVVVHKPNTFASLTTAAATAITSSTATSGGNVAADGGAAITARGVCWGTATAPTVALPTKTTEAGTTGAFTSSLTGLTAGALYYVRAYATNSIGTAYGNEVSFTTLAPPFPCGSSITINHVAGTLAPVTKIVTYGTVTNIPGEPTKCWITSNLGADHQATAVDDATEASAGWYWQFNRLQGYKHDGTSRTPNTAWINPINENSDWFAANDPCALSLGTGWRLPTNTEWTNVDATGNWATWTGPYNSALKLHAAGQLYSNDGSLGNRGYYGDYWSSTQYDASNGRHLDFNSGYSIMTLSTKAVGWTARCITDAVSVPVVPTVTTASVSNIGQTTATSGGNVTSDGGAGITTRGICWGTATAPTTTLPTKTTEAGTTGAFTSNLTGLTAGTLYYVRAYATHSAGTAYGNEVSFTTLVTPFTCGLSTLTINHVAGTLAPVTKTVTYGTVTNIYGDLNKCWITSNLGADHQATAVDDATEASAGWYWQFNRMQGFKHDGTTRTPNTTWINPISENSNWLAANDPCALSLGTGWRIPTYTEWTDLYGNGNWIDWTDSYNSGLYLHAAGYLGNSSGSLTNRGSSGYYWSSTQQSVGYGWHLNFGNGFSGFSWNRKAYGFPARCINDVVTVPVIPTITTASVSSIGQTTALSGGDVTFDGNAGITARGVCWGTATAPTTALPTKTTESGTTGAFTSNLTGLSPGTLYYVRAYATNYVGTTYGNEVSFTTLWTCGAGITINHVAGTLAPVTKTVIYGTVTNIPGEPTKCWITSNLGADHQATAVNDATEASAGWYWQFNRMQGFKHDGTTRTPATTWINSISENSDWLPANDPCALSLGTGWRLPTSTEWTNVDASGNWTTWTGPWNSGLKLHAAGYLNDSDGGLYNNRGFSGIYWSSTQNGGASIGWGFYFYSSNSNMNSYYLKAYGFSIRCIKDAVIVPIVPTVTTTSVSNIGQTTATNGGNVTADGGAGITARGICWGTAIAPTTALPTKTTEAGTTGAFTSNLTGLSPGTLYYVRSYATNYIGTAYGNEVSFTTLWACGAGITINHVAGILAPVTKTVSYGTVTNIPGEPTKCWITSNLGADHQATAVNDATEASAGWYWQFNRMRGYKHDGTTRTPNTTWITNINENSQWAAVTDPCTIELGSGWRIPTNTEWTNVDATGGWTTWNGPWNSWLKLHAAGELYYINGSLDSRGSNGFYWSNTQAGSAYGNTLVFESFNSSINNQLKWCGFPVRCIKE